MSPPHHLRHHQECWNLSDSNTT